MNKAEQLIACLESEIAKRDARIGELENDASYYAARNEELRAELAAIKTQEPVAVVLKEADYWSGGHFYEGHRPYIPSRDVFKLPIGTKLYSAPVAKPQVVMPERKPWRILGHAVQFHAQGWNECLDEVARLNAAYVQHDSDCSTNNRGVPDLLGPCDCSAAPVQQVSVADEFPAMWHVSDLIGGETDSAEQSLEVKRFTPISAGDHIPTMNPCISGRWMKVEQHLHILAATADMLAAAPAAPAADVVN